VHTRINAHSGTWLSIILRETCRYAKMENDENADTMTGVRHRDENCWAHAVRYTLQREMVTHTY
jgi:hypothetical protein